MSRIKLKLAGKRFGRLLVLESAGKGKYKQTLWLCQCDCGSKVVVIGGSLTCGDKQSCGCLARETRGLANRTHGQTKTRLYKIWLNMRNRCNNKKSSDYARYGGRGIAVCSEWLFYESFYQWAEYSGYAESLTLDRIDNNLGYSPLNCRWSTQKEQQNNRRNNVIIRGRPLSVVCDELGLNANRIRTRINRGWTTERAISTPIKKRSKHGN